MKIRTKLALGIAFLFAEFLLVSLLSLYFIYKISQQNNLITKDNNLSIGYVENMLQSIDRINDFNASSIFNPNFLIYEKELSGYINEFELNLVGEEHNITEPGEMELAKTVREDFAKLKVQLARSVNDSVRETPGYYFSNLMPLVTEIKFALFAISDANMNAIIRKNAVANETATHSYIVLSVIATLCLIVFFAFIFSFPHYIADPIEKLAESMKEVSNKNFESRVHFNSTSEFGEISKRYDQMVSKLKDYDKLEIGKLRNEALRAGLVLNTLDEAMILLDENQKITFVNIAAEKLLGLNRSDMIHKTADEVAAGNEFMRHVTGDLSQGTVKSKESFIKVTEGVRSVYEREVRVITAYDNGHDVIRPLGYRISITKL
jgi:PAS domain S-box-containing protein